MRILITLILLLLATAIIVFTHRQLARQISAPLHQWLVHLLILGVAMAFGWLVAGVYMGAEEGGGIAAFVAALGVAHLPPALVMWLRQAPQ